MLDQHPTMVRAHHGPRSAPALRPARQRSARSAALLVLTALAASLPGCVSFSTVQTARTMAPGQVQVAVGAGSVGLSSRSQDVSFDSNGNEVKGPVSTETASIPEIEMGGRLGLMPGLDVGVKLSLPLNLMSDVKFQFVDSGPFAAAVGAGIGYQEFSVNEESIKTIDVVVPLYLSYDLTRWLTLYASPKYFLRNVTTGSKAENLHLAGATGGIKLGSRFGLYIEATQLAVLNQSNAADAALGFSQAHVALFFDFGDPRPSPPPAPGPKDGPGDAPPPGDAAPQEPPAAPPAATPPAVAPPAATPTP